MARAARKDVTDEEREALLSRAQDDLSRVLEADPNDMQAMFTKVELLLLQKDFDQAIQVIQKRMELDKEGRENSKIMTEKLDRAKMAMDEGREEEADQIMEEIEQFHQEGHSVSRFKKGVGLDLLLQMAKAQELVQEWEAAIETYKRLFHETYEDFSVATPVQQRKLLMGISRCFYKVGNYKGAIAMGEGAIDMNRHFPGVYKYVALSYRETGDRQMAKTTMNRAVLYETPWDDQNREEAYELFKDLASEDS
jgi:tetratricopeptide (TPR) repeat protein